MIANYFFIHKSLRERKGNVMNYSIKPFEMKDLPFLWEMLYQSIHVPEGQEVPSLDILKEPTIEKYLNN